MTELDNSTVYLSAQNVSDHLTTEWEKLVEVIEKALKSYSDGKIIQPVRVAVPVEKQNGY